MSSDKKYVGSVDLFCQYCGEGTPVKVFAWTEDNTEDMTTSIFTSTDTQEVWIHYLEHSIDGELDD